MTDHLKNIFTIPDIVDLEFFFHQDREDDDTGADQLHQRDRDIFLSDIAPIVTDMGEDSLKRKIAIRRWLDVRRRSDAGDDGIEESRIPPGKALQTALNLMGFILVCCGMGAGFGMAASLLFYSGNHPVNVTLFVGLLVVVQIILILFLLLIWGIGRAGLYPGAMVIQAVVTRLMNWMVRKSRPSISGETSGRMTAAKGVFQRMKSIYGNLVVWPFFTLAQLFGIAFNVGVLLSAWVRILGTDLAFGWQSTLQIGSETAYRIVSYMSLPWAWIVPTDLAHPTLAQIQGSRIILKDGIARLSNTDMASWWPFLLFSVICYGLLPRLLLYTTARIGERRVLCRIAFDTYDCDRLWMRMTTPVIGEIMPEEPVPGPMPEAIVPEVVSEIEVADSYRDGLVVLLSEDLFDQVPHDALPRLTQRITGISSQVAMAATLDFSRDRETLTEKKSAHLTHILFLQEGWQPPIREMLYYLKELRLFVGKEVKIIVCLVGKPEGDNVLTVVTEADYRIWQHSIQGLADPRTLLERTVT